MTTVHNVATKEWRTPGRREVCLYTLVVPIRTRPQNWRISWNKDSCARSRQTPKMPACGCRNLERGLSWSWTGHERLFLAKSVQVRSPQTQTLGGESAGFIYTVGRGIYLAVGAQINADRARSRDLPEPQRHPACRVVALLAQVCITRVSPAAVGCFLLARKMSPIHESIFCHRKCNSPTLTPCVCLVFARSQPPTPTVMFSPCLSGFVVHR